MNGKPCCSPPTGREPIAPLDVYPSGDLTLRDRAILVQGGQSFIGSNSTFIPADEEGPLRKVKLRDFRLSPSAVSNAEFGAFVKDTGYVTEAERFGWSFVFHAQVPKHIGPTDGVPGFEWWRRVYGADWRNIHGPSDEAPGDNLPVVHISWNDAQAFAKWAGGRLPTEAEWEHAARAGRGDILFPWGDQEPNDTDFQPCNIWQGQFPNQNLALDGYETTAPVDAFEPNPWGFYNLAGNVWEWVSDPYKLRSLKRGAKERQAQMRGYKISKGGSFLCHKSYCYRYRIAARSGNSPDSTTTHQGFRLAFDA